MSKDGTYIALPPDLSGPWAYGHGAGPVAWAKNDLDKAKLSGLDDVVLILAGENVRRFELDLLGLRGRELQSAIDFELEDRIGGALSGEVICQDRKHVGRVALVCADYAERLTQITAQYNLSPRHVIIDYELIGDGQDFHIGTRLMKGGIDGYVVSEDWSALLLDTPSFKSITPEDLFDRFRLALSHDEGASLDLKSGLGLKAASSFDWQRWAKFAAMAAGLIILPFMLDRFAQARAWTAQAENDQAAMSQLYEEATGEATRDVARSVSQHLKNRKSTVGFLDMSAVLFAAVADVEGAEIDTMRYDPRQNLIQLSVRYPSFEAGAALERAVSARGGRLIVGGIRERGETLVGEASFDLGPGGGS